MMVFGVITNDDVNFAHHFGIIEERLFWVIVSASNIP